MWEASPSLMEWMDYRNCFLGMAPALPENDVCISLKVSLASASHATHRHVGLSSGEELDVPNTNLRYTSYLRQSPGVTILKPLKTNYQEEIQKWMTFHLRHRVQDENIAAIFAAADLRNCGMKLAVGELYRTGIFSFNKDIFP